jgi:threonine aldolase
MRQAGILAAAGLHALEHHVDRLAEDHRNAELLARGLQNFEQLRVDIEKVQTNMVFAAIEADLCRDLAAFLLARGILISPGSSLRLVTHLDIDSRDIQTVINAIAAFFQQHRLGKTPSREKQALT